MKIYSLISSFFVFAKLINTIFVRAEIKDESMEMLHQSFSLLSFSSSIRSSPSEEPSSEPTLSPSLPSLSVLPTLAPTYFPTFCPSSLPSFIPSAGPSIIATERPTQRFENPSNEPSYEPTITPSIASRSSINPITDPTFMISTLPLSSPPIPPTQEPSLVPSEISRQSGTFEPSTDPSVAPTIIKEKENTVIPSFSFNIAFSGSDVGSNNFYGSGLISLYSIVSLPLPASNSMTLSNIRTSSSSSITLMSYSMISNANSFLFGSIQSLGLQQPTSEMLSARQFTGESFITPQQSQSFSISLEGFSNGFIAPITPDFTFSSSFVSQVDSISLPPLSQLLSQQQSGNIALSHISLHEENKFTAEPSFPLPLTIFSGSLGESSQMFHVPGSIKQSVAHSIDQSVEHSFSIAGLSTVSALPVSEFSLSLVSPILFSQSMFSFSSLGSSTESSLSRPRLIAPTVTPTTLPSIFSSPPPNHRPNLDFTITPSLSPTSIKTELPTILPSILPTVEPSITPSGRPSPGPGEPTKAPSANPSLRPSEDQTEVPSLLPSVLPSEEPTVIPSRRPTPRPGEPTWAPTVNPSLTPTFVKSEIPSTIPSILPSAEPSVVPSRRPTPGPGEPTWAPTPVPSASPTFIKTELPTLFPSVMPSAEPSATPSKRPTPGPGEPTWAPTSNPTVNPSALLTRLPTIYPSLIPTAEPSSIPSRRPTPGPGEPTWAPSSTPSTEFLPSVEPSIVPSLRPPYLKTEHSSVIPTEEPSFPPSLGSSLSPSTADTVASPTSVPSSLRPSAAPSSRSPIREPTRSPSCVPTSRVGGPTFAPSTQNFPILSFDTNVGLDGLSSSELDDLAIQAVISTTAEIQEVQEDEVVFLGSQVVGRRRLQDTFSVQANLRTTVNMVDYQDKFAGGNTTAAYKQFTKLLSEAASSGSFTTRLRAISAEIGATITLNAETGEIVFSEPIVVLPPTPAPTSAPVEPILTGLEIVSIALGSVILLVIFLLFCHFCMRKKGKRNVQIYASFDDELDA